MKTKYFNLILVLLSGLMYLTSCKKEWLDAKPDKSLVVPTTIEDYQAILDNTSSALGAPFNYNQNSLNEIGAGDFYVTDPNWASRGDLERNLYIWAPDIYGATIINNLEWDIPYRRIFYTNIVLEGIEKIHPANSIEQSKWNQAQGSALFFRAFNHFTIALQYSKPFIKSSANGDLGIPLRLESDVNIRSVRSSVSQTYSQILTDLKMSADILPISTPINDLYKLRPNKAAVNAMLSRVYLSMGEYDSAFVYSNKSLQQYNTLMDYNNSPFVISSSNSPILRFSPEILFHMEANDWTMFSILRLIIEPGLLSQYNITNDLRFPVFFRLRSGVYTFKGNYSGSISFFGGIAVDEIILTRAECNARKGNTAEAIQDLNTLLVKRWRTGTFVPLTAVNSADALNKILIERRKELCFRGIRWMDLRRLNQEPQFAVTLTRTVNSQTYTLPPNSPLYVLPIPPGVIQLSGIQQNPR